MTTQAWLWSAAAAALTALGAGLMDRRRGARRDLDSPGWMPWPLIQLLAMLVAAVALALALRAG